MTNGQLVRMTTEQAVDEVAKTYCMTEDEREMLIRSKTAKIVAEMPYLVMCKNPRRACLAGLGILFTAHKDDSFDHQPGDTLRDRMFDLMAVMKSGNPDLLEIEMAKLELLSLEDHNEDRKQDEQSGKYNPINSGEIDYPTTKRSILERLKGIFNAGPRGTWL